MPYDQRQFPWLAFGQAGGTAQQQLLKLQQQWLEAMGLNRGAATSVQDRLDRLERRVAELEAVNEIQRFMYRWAYLLDQTQTLEGEAAKTACWQVAHEMMTPDGTFDFTEIPDWLGVWGPQKQDIVDKLMVFGNEISWSYHLYCNASPTVDLECGAASYTTQAELVPLLAKTGTWLFLSQASELKLIAGKWRMHRYKLSNLRQVDTSLRPIGGLGSAPAKAKAKATGERRPRRVVQRGG